MGSESNELVSPENQPAVPTGPEGTAEADPSGMDFAARIIAQVREFTISATGHEPKGPTIVDE